MTKRPKDDFDIVLIKKLKIKQILFDKKEGGFDGLFYDQDNNLIIIIKKTDNSIDGYGVDLLQKDEGLIDWVSKIIIEMSTTNGNLYSKLNAEVAQKIYQAISDQKLRRILIYQRTDTHVFIMSEYYQNETWKYISTARYFLGHFWKGVF